MKKKPISRFKFVLIWIMIYVAVLILGFLLCLGITYSHSSNTPNRAKEDMAYYIETGKFSPNVQANNAHNYVYAPDGTRIDYSIPDIGKKFNIDTYAAKQLSQIQGAEYSMKLMFHPNLPRHFAITVALPMENGNMFFFLRELSIYSALIIIFVSATVVVVSSALLMALVIRNNKKTEKIQQEYVANISHELKSPIASVRAITETIRDGLVDNKEQQQEYCDIMLHELYNLEHTVTNMLELSKIQSQQIDCQKHPQSSKDVFGSITTKYAALCYEMGIGFQTSPSWDLCPMIHTNKNLASRMLDIVLDNAIKYTEPDGLIQVRITTKAKKAIISVIDAGPGIATEDQPYIFTRFYKSKNSHIQKGSGLGLAIANEIAQSLGEKIWLNKTSSSGSEFSFTIELAE